MTRGRTSVRAAVQAALQACETAQGLGAFWSIAAERALDHAERIDRERAGGARLGRLAGVGLAVKDNFDVSGLATTGGLPGPWVTASRDAAAVTALERAGAIAIGKTAMDPLGWSTHGEAPGFLPCLNPVDTSLSPGGSSAGSAAAVAAGVVPLGLGTDTAGSVRIPASYCGIVGLKPPWGEVSLERCLPLAPRFDTVGVLATSVRGCAAGYQALTGAQLNAHAPARVGVLCDLMEQADPEVRSVCRSALRRLEASGVRLVECALDWRGRDFGCVLAVEIARTWGAAVRSEPERFPSDMRDAIASAAEVDEASFDKALARLEAAADGLGRRTGDVEAVLCPTVPVAVPEREQEKVEVSTRFTRPFSAMRWAAMSLPCGVDGVGRPVGLQVASGHGVPSVIAVGLGLEAAIG